MMTINIWRRKHAVKDLYVSLSLDNLIYVAVECTISKSQSSKSNNVSKPAFNSPNHNRQLEDEERKLMKMQRKVLFEDLSWRPLELLIGVKISSFTNT